MAKTIQVRVDDELMVLMASMEAGGIPFAVTHGVNRDSVITEAIERRKNGSVFLTAEQSLANMRGAIKKGGEHGI